MPEQIVISDILPTHNPHPGRLRRTIESLAAQTLPRDAWELLVVDNANVPVVSSPEVPNPSIHLVAELATLTANARWHGDLLFPLPGMFSFNLWSKLPTLLLTSEAVADGKFLRWTCHCPPPASNPQPFSNVVRFIGSDDTVLAEVRFERPLPQTNPE